MDTGFATHRFLRTPPDGQTGPTPPKRTALTPLLTATLCGVTVVAEAQRQAPPRPPGSPAPSRAVPRHPPKDDGSVRVSVVDSVYKVRPGVQVPSTGEAVLSAARGACEGVQFVFEPPLTGVSVAAPRLRDARGNELPVALYHQQYVNLTTASSSEGFTGLAGDRLVPVAASLPANSTAAEPLVVYAETCVPLGTPPGTYRGDLLVQTSDGKGDRVPVQVEVLTIELPKTTSRDPVIAGLDLWTLVKGHGMDGSTPEARALLNVYTGKLLERGIDSYYLTGESPRIVRWNGSTPEIDFTQWDAQMAPFLDGTSGLASGAKFSAVQIQALPLGGTTQEQKNAYYRAFARHLAERGWTQQTYVLTADEPSRAQYDLVMQQARAVQAAGVFPVLITTPPSNDTLRGFANILASPINCYFQRDGEGTGAGQVWPSCENAIPYPRVRADLPPNVQIWWYQSCLSHGCNGGPLSNPALENAFRGWPSLMIDASVPQNRALAVLRFRDGVQGELYYSVVEAYADTNRDPWVDVFRHGGNGDGTLFYPQVAGKRGATTHAPVISRRLVEWGDGIQTARMLRRLEELGFGVEAHDFAERLVGRSGEIRIVDPAEWARLKAELARYLDARELSAR